MVLHFPVKNSFFLWAQIHSSPNPSLPEPVERLHLQLIEESDSGPTATSAGSCRATSSSIIQSLRLAHRGSASSPALTPAHMVPTHTVASGGFVRCRLNALRLVIPGYFAAFLFQAT